MIMNESKSIVELVAGPPQALSESAPAVRSAVRLGNNVSPDPRPRELVTQQDVSPEVLHDLIQVLSKLGDDVERLISNIDANQRSASARGN